MSKSEFVIQKYSNADKSIEIFETPEDWNTLVISIDYDDVDRDRIKKKVKKMVDILNKYWDKEK